jgi:hypothetical protein
MFAVSSYSTVILSFEIYHFTYCRFQRNWHTRKPYSEFFVILFIWFLAFVSFHNGNHLYLNHNAYSCSKEMCITLCFTYLFDRQMIKSDCMTSDEVYNAHVSRTIVWVVHQPLNMLCICIWFLIGHTVYVTFSENILAYLEYLTDGHLYMHKKKLKINIFIIFHVGLCFSGPGVA